MKFKVTTTNSSEADINAIYDYIVDECDGYDGSAKKVYRKIYEQIMSLTDMPMRNKICGKLYSVKAYKYRVIYEVDEDNKTVRVLHVWHGKRDILKLLKRIIKDKSN